MPFPFPTALLHHVIRKLSTLALFAAVALSGTAAGAARTEAVPSAPTDAPLLDAAGLRADVDLLQRTYTLLHPGLLRYNSEAQIAAGFDRLRATFAQDTSLEQAYLAFSEFAATVQCGHTYANFYNQPRAIQQRLFERGPRLPFHFRWLDRRMVVTANHSAEGSLAPGTEILAIDGIPVQDILERLLPIARADGGNDAKRVAWLEVQGMNRYEAFDIFLPLYFPQIGQRLSLQVRSPDATSARDVVVDAIDDAARRQHQRPDDSDTNGAPAWTVDWSDPAFAVLRMPTWALYDSSWDWRAFLRDTFAQLETRGTPALVIDVRGNEGGLGVGDVLLAHLTDRDIVLPPTLRLVRYRRVPDDLVPHLDTWDKSFRDWGVSAAPRDTRFYRLDRYDDASGQSIVRPLAPRYAGRVFLLVGAENSSATFEFAQQLQQSGLGTLVGQPTGGNRRGINGGAFFFLQLPHSGIELDVPLIGQFPVQEQPDAGIEPEVFVQPTAADIAAGRDAELDAVRGLLANPAGRGA